MAEQPTKNYSKKPKSLTYRTPDRFRRLVLKRNPATAARVRSFGGHR